MKKLGKTRRIAASLLIAGLAAGIPVAGTMMPATAFAAETGDIILTIKQSEGGTVTSSASGSLKEGENVDLTAVADEGYRFVRWNLRSDGYHEVVKGSERDSSITVKVHESDAGLFTAEAVFAKDYLHSVTGLPGLPEFARAGDVLDLGEGVKAQVERSDASENYTFTLGVIRVSDGADITDEVYDKKGNTVTVPDADIEIFTEVLSANYYDERILDEFGSDDMEFAIENDTDGVAELPDHAQAGEEVEIVFADTEIKKNVSYRIERTDDGMDMTDALVMEDPEADGSVVRFIMPSYDIRVYVGSIEYLTTDELPEENAENNVYKISITDGKGLSANLDEAAEGDTVELNYDRTEEGKTWYLDSFVIMKADTLEDVTYDLFNSWSNTFVTFEMPGYDIVIDVVDYSVSDDAKPSLKLIQTEGGTISFEGEDYRVDSFGNATFEIKAEPDEGWYFKKWVFKDCEGFDTSSLYMDVDVPCSESYDENQERAFSYSDSSEVYAVFEKKQADEYAVYDAYYAEENKAFKAGEPVTVSLKGASLGIYSADGENKDLTKEIVFERNTETDEVTFIMPECDVRLSYFKTIPPYVAFSIDNASELAIVPESASPGDVINVETKQPDPSVDGQACVTADYKIYNADSGEEVTSEISKNNGRSFVMPDYPVRIETWRFASSMALSNDLTETKGSDEETGYEEVIKDSFQPEEDGDDKKTELSSEEDAAGSKASENVTTAGADGTAKTTAVSGIKVNAPAAVSAAPVSSAVSTTQVSLAGSAPSVSAVRTSAPAVVRAEGSSSVTASSVSSPATGDYNVTFAFTMAAIAAGAGIIAAAVVMKRKTED